MLNFKNKNKIVFFKLELFLFLFVDVPRDNKLDISLKSF